MTSHPNGFRRDGSPLITGSGRANFLDVDILDTRKKNPLLNSRLATGLIPTIIALVAILTFSIVRYLFAVDQNRAADIALAMATATARYPLATRDIVRDRSGLMKRSADAIIQHLNEVNIAIAPLVNFANAVPAQVRIKTVVLDPLKATITSGEALNYQAIVDASTQLNHNLPTTITTVGLGADSGNGTDANARSSTWNWTGYVSFAPHAAPGGLPK